MFSLVLVVANVKKLNPTEEEMKYRVEITHLQNNNIAIHESGIKGIAKKRNFRIPDNSYLPSFQMHLYVSRREYFTGVSTSCKGLRIGSRAFGNMTKDQFNIASYGASYN